MHVRIPTHQGLDHHLSWVLYNRPADAKIYLISTDQFEIHHAIKIISQYDPTGIFVSVHNNDSNVVDSFGNINCVTKWPTYLEVMSTRVFHIHDQFNPYDCARDQKFRNYIVNNNHRFFRHNPILDRKQLSYHIDKQQKWYDIRHRAQPHEVNESMYIVNVELEDRLFEISCRDICSDKFLSWFDHFMSCSQVSTDYDQDTVKNNHNIYIQAQKNLQWFDSFEHWSATGQLDDYLLSHSIIESQIIIEILKNSGIVDLTFAQQDQWTSFYARCRGPDWPDAKSEYDFFDLPAWVQQEIQKFGYQFNLTTQPIKAILELDWKNTSIVDINRIYQQHKGTNHEETQS